MTFFIIYTATIVLWWSVGKTFEILTCVYLSTFNEVYLSFRNDSNKRCIHHYQVLSLNPFLGTTTSAQLGKLQPPPSTFLTSPATVTVIVDQSAIVSCSESGGTVRWYGPDGGVVPSGGDVRQVVDK